MPDVKKQLEEVDKKEAKEKTDLQKQHEAPGPVVLPAWTSKVPQLKPDGPAAKEIVSDEVNISKPELHLSYPLSLEIVRKRRKAIVKQQSH